MGLWSLLSSICLAVMVVMLVIYYGVWRSNSGRAEFFFVFTISVFRLLKVLDMYYATSVKNETSQVYSQTGEYYSGGEISFLEQDCGFHPTCCIFLARVGWYYGWAVTRLVIWYLNCNCTIFLSRWLQVWFLPSSYFLFLLVYKNFVS